MAGGRPLSAATSGRTMGGGRPLSAATSSAICFGKPAPHGETTPNTGCRPVAGNSWAVDTLTGRGTLEDPHGLYSDWNPGTLMEPSAEVIPREGTEDLIEPAYPAENAKLPGKEGHAVDEALEKFIGAMTG